MREVDFRYLQSALVSLKSVGRGREAPILVA